MADEEKEPWPGAGINFDRLNSGDPKRAEEHLAQMSAQDRRKWLERFSIEFDHEKKQSRISPGRMSDFRLRLLNEMEARCYERHGHLTKKEELEAKGQVVEVAESEDPHEQESLMPDGGIDCSDLESIKREVQNYESLEQKIDFLTQVAITIKKEFAAAETEWIATGRSEWIAAGQPNEARFPACANKVRWGKASGRISPWITQTKSKYVRWLDLRTGKEQWPGASIDLDLKNIRDDDLDLFELVEERLNSLPDYKTKIAFLKRFMAQLRHESGMGGNDHGSASKGAQYLYGRCESAVRMFEQLAELEMAPEPLAKNADKEIEDDEAGEESRSKPEFTTAQCCLAIHYLLHAAGHKTRDKAVEQLIVALTPYNKHNVRHRLQDMLSRKTQTIKDLAKLKPYFEQLGIRQIVELIETQIASGVKDDDED